MRRLAAVCMIAAMLLAGCSGGDVEEEKKSQVRVKDGSGNETTVEVGVDDGALVGDVIDEAGVPVWDAHVAVLGSDRFADADRDGRFAIQNLTPGPHRIRVTAPDYLAAEEQVTIEAGEVTVIEVLLIPKETLGPGYRPHVHDFWGSRTEVTVVDQDVTYDHAATASVYQVINTSCAGSGTQDFFFDEENQLVYPGTRALRVTISWDGDQAPSGVMRFHYLTAGAAEWAVTDDLPNGEATEVPIEPGDWDSPHQSFSLWSLQLCKGTEHPRYADGTFHVVLELLKGPDWEPGFDEPHPRFWNETDRHRIIEDKGYDYTQLIYEDTRQTQAFNGGNPYSTGRFYVYPGDKKAFQGAEEGVLVPPGTSYLEAWLNWTYTDVVRGDAKPWSLTYRTAEMHPQGLRPADLIVAEPEETRDGSKHYIIPVERGQADGFYQTRSNWMFFLNLEGEEAAEDYLSPCYPCGIDVKLTVVAWRDEAGDTL